MRFVSYRYGNKSRYGVLTGEGIVELSRYFPRYRSLGQCLAGNKLEALEQFGDGIPPHFSEDEVEYEIPVPDAGKIICAGINYPARHGEYRDDAPTPDHPSLFVRFPDSLVGHRQPIVRPPESNLLDYEGEIVLAIGKSGRRISERDAIGHIGGLSLCNEGTVRDWTRHAKFNVTQGKNFDQSGSMGPWLVRFESPQQLADIELTTRVNGVIRQRDRTSRMLFSPARLISYISTFTTLHPGDLIVTGTPVGAGARMNPPCYLEPGDLVEVSATGLGTLQNRITG
ncbi:MAG: fumarylacetoacetate hydrolase family protein [Rhodobacteraceae bacterium]|nr:fumarylacetoacetate hydrolase family protein [Paracoccaceae bacterium]